MNWDNLKEGIESIVRENGNEEITGQNLQQVLKTIVNSLGANASFAGVAGPNTSPGIPDGPVFYFARRSGIYPNFSRIVVPENVIGILIYDDNIWRLETIPVSGGGGGGGSISNELNVKDYGAVGDAKTDDTAAIQSTIDAAFQQKKAVRIPAGTYRITRTLWVYDGIELRGDGIYNTIVQTAYGTNSTAKGYVGRDKNKNYSTLTNPSGIPSLDVNNGHNRFYIGGGIVGFYDSDRDTNPNHPLYWPNDGSEEWRSWKKERDKIVSRGSWVGLTGRENYGGGVFKSMQIPGLTYPSGYSHLHPSGPIWTGIRNVKFSDFQINTNGADRGRDSAIDFQYKASAIPPGSTRETYDSSVLNVQLYNMYLFSLGRSGYRATRAVDHTFIGCYVRQTASQGFYIDGVTSVFFTGCYANSCVEAGYALKGCNYCNLSSCAADSCSIGYNINNCNGITLNACGAEATRYQPAGEDEEEDPLKGRAFSIQNSDGVSLVSCYAMTTHPQVYKEALEITDSEADESWNKSRHVYVNNSKNVQVSYCHFKSFERARTNAYRNDNNEKCNYQGGIYDPTQPGSRYWQIQNYLVGAQYEVRSEDSSVQIVASEKEDYLRKLSEIRVGNLDILDPGIVPNPAAGFSTSGKTISGSDGNGGWTYTDPNTQVVSKITIENFEFVFPINGKKQYRSRDYFWAWRNSLKLVRKKNDTSLRTSYPSRYYGYMNVLCPSPINIESYFQNNPVNWGAVSSEDMDKFTLNVVTDYNSPGFIDGSKSLFTYGKLFYESLDSPIAYAPKIYSPIPAFVRDKPDGHRTALNTNSVDGIPSVLSKAAVMVVGNENRAATDETEEIIAGMVFSAVSKKKGAETDYTTVHSKFSNLNFTDILSIYEKGRVFSTGNARRVISRENLAYNPINRVVSGTTAEMVTALNKVIACLENHGLIEKTTEVSFGDPYAITFVENDRYTWSEDVSAPAPGIADDEIKEIGFIWGLTPEGVTDQFDGGIIGSFVYQNNSYLTTFNMSVEYIQGHFTIENNQFQFYLRFYCDYMYTKRIVSGIYKVIGDLSLGSLSMSLLGGLSFSVPTVNSVGNSSDGISGHLSVYLNEVIEGGTTSVVKKGVAFSSNSQEPTYVQNHLEFTGDIAEVPFSSSQTVRYIRFYVETVESATESNRIYSPSYVVNLNRNQQTATIQSI